LKKSLKIIGLSGILLLYCFVISIYSGIAFNSDPTFSKHSSSEKDVYKAIISASTFFHTAETEIAVAVCNSFRPASLKNNFSGFSSLAKTTQQLFSASFLQYKSYSKNWFVGLKKTALIFPFHYFW